MKVKELIKHLQKYDLEQDVIIRFVLDKEDEIGYVLEPFETGLYFKDECAIYAEYTATKEDCDFIGQVDLKEAYQKMREVNIVDIEKAIKILKEFVKQDRKMRDYKVESDYDKFCEERCIAIETVLNELEKKDKIIDEMAEELVEAHEWFYSEFDNFTKKDFIEYFTKKVEDK